MKVFSISEWTTKLICGFPLLIFIISFLFSLFHENEETIEKYCPNANSHLWISLFPSFGVIIYALHAGFLDLHVFVTVFNCVLICACIIFDLHELSKKCSIKLNETYTFYTVIYQICILILLLILNFLSILKTCCKIENNLQNNSQNNLQNNFQNNFQNNRNIKKNYTELSESTPLNIIV